MKTTDLLQIGLLGAVAYLLYKGFNFAKDTANQATDAVAQKIVDWFGLLPAPSTMYRDLLGNILFPGNIRVPLSQFSGQVKTDSDGNVFVRYAGFVWQLSPSNANGDWPATRVS